MRDHMACRTITGEAPFTLAHVVGPWPEVGTLWGAHLPGLRQVVAGGFSSRGRFMRCAVTPWTSHWGSDKLVRRKAI